VYDILDFAIQLALESGRIQKKHFRGDFAVRHKGEINLVTDVDLECQARIIGLIQESFPEDEIIAEEQQNTFHSSKNRWIIDPIDGTTNYAHGYPFFCTSIAYEAQGEVIAGVVYSPIFDELFFTKKGGGAFLNGESLRVSKTASVKQALLATGFPYDINTSPKNNLSNWSRFLFRAQALRRDGSAALNLAYVAAGRFDGFWEIKLHSWDIAAASLMVTEAGGLITGLKGEEFSLYNGDLCASNGIVHEEMIRILKEGP
jgi:myo-inositol-1(or 4)-monophosphatase